MILIVNRLYWNLSVWNHSLHIDHIRENKIIRQIVQPRLVPLPQIPFVRRITRYNRNELVQIYLGKGDIYSDTTINLNGDASTFRSDIGYIGQHTHIIDMNEVVNHFGKHTESEINVGGALRDGAKKIFRGTIDFKTGSSDSVGNELENVLMLGDDVENKTVPVILCSEENVVGNHGATIGELDEDTMFYFASRGIDKEHAENIMARANIDRLKGIIKDDSFARMIDEELGEV